MTEVEEPKETRSDRKRRQILEAATEHFLADGYERTSMDDVARRAGVSKQTVYQHFQTKADLLSEVVVSVISHAGPSPTTDRQPRGDERSARDLRVYARAAAIGHATDPDEVASAHRGRGPDVP